MFVCMYIHCTWADEMLAKVQEAGFEIAMQKELTLTKEQAAEFYREHEGKDYFESLCNTMSRFVHAITCVHLLVCYVMCVLQWSNAGLVSGQRRCSEWLEGYAGTY